ncbi:gustatory receptor for sugar taste 64f-like [Bacillus rossius redtenbacheri]|uniref:gustatory receptor for sugar taste 64f-like n=1 Tax=Bacillus rossius redtenbacheri TaxID=93214 RepID=UPI002FDE83ED
MQTSVFPRRPRGTEDGDTRGAHLAGRFASDRNSLFGATRAVVVAAQFFALLPVHGITGPNASALEFRWRSARTARSLLMAASHAVAFCFCSNRFFSARFTFSNIAQVIFFLYACGMTLAFVRLATRWPGIARRWEWVELETRGYGHPRGLARKVRAIAASALALAALEHVFSNVSKLRRGLLCSRGGADWVRAYFVNNYSHVFALTNYSVWKGAATLYVNVIATFTWTFADLFLIVVSVAVAARFRALNEFLRGVRGKEVSHRLWGKVRRDYNQLTRLAARLDSCLSGLVLLSFANNMYFICLQLNYSLRLRGLTLDAAYFYTSLTFIVLRAAAVLFCAASVHDESKQPKRILQSVPSRSYCLEVERLLLQVSCHDVAFTGLHLFSVNHRLILTVFSAVITYQIVLIQMNASSTYEYSVPSGFNASTDCLQ